MADVTATVRTVIAVVDQATGPLRGIQAQFQKFTAPMRGIADKFKGLGDTTGLSNLGKSLGGIAQKAGGVAKSIAGVGLALTGLGGIAGGLGLRSVVGWMNEMVSAGGALHDTAPKLGVTVEQLQELRHWAQMGGVEAGTMQGAVSKLNKNLGDMATGKGKAAAEAFKKLGVTATDAKGKVRPAADLLPAIADGLKKVESPAERAALAMALFGRSGVEMLPALLEGGAAIKTAAEEARKLGIISSADAKLADEFGEAQEKLSAAIVGVQRAIGAKLLPVLLPIIEAMREWVMLNRDWLAGKVEEGITAVAAALRQVDWSAWLERGKTVLGFLARLVELLGGVDKAVMLLAGVKFAGPLASMASTFLGLVGTVGKLAAAFGLFTPVGAILAGLAAAAFLIYKNWDRIGPVVERAWSAIKDGVVGAVDAVKQFAADVGAWLDKSIAAVVGWGRRFVAAFADTWQAIKDGAGAVLERLGDTIGPALDQAIAVVAEWGRRFGAAFADVWDGIKDGMARALGGAADLLGPVLDPLKDAAARMFEGLKAAFDAGWRGISGVLELLKSALGGVVGLLDRAAGIAERVSGYFGRIVEGLSTTVPEATAAAERTADEATRRADKAAIKAQRSIERAEEAHRRAEAAAGGVPGAAAPAPEARGPGPWLPELMPPAGGAPASGTVDVIITAPNQPPGTRVAAKATGAGLRTKTDVGYSMPQLQPAGA